MWIALSLLAAGIWAVVNITDKYVISKNAVKPAIPVFILSIIGLMAGLSCWLVIKPEFSRLLFLGLVIGASYPAVNFLYFKSLKMEDVSRVVPWFALESVLVIIFSAVLLDEILSVRQYLGALVIITGLFFMTVKKNFSLRPGKWMIYMLLADIIFAAQVLLEKYILNNIRPLELFAALEIGAFVGFLPYWYYNRKIIKKFLTHETKIAKIIMANETANIGATLILLTAMSGGYAALVTVLASTQYFFILLLAVLVSLFYPRIIREELSVSLLSLKAVAILLIISGIYLIT